jgi:ABC-type branched-subunit amino acid transport system ATPase component
MALALTETCTEKLANHQSNRPSDRVVLSATGLCKSFGGHTVLDNVSFKLKRGQVVLLRGENGSGKTTLLNILTGNLEPDSGEIKVSINGNEERFDFPMPWWKRLNPFDHFTPERLAWKGIGRVWQDIRLFPTMTTLDNVAVASPNQIGENPALAFIASKIRKAEKKNVEESYKRLEGLRLGKLRDSYCDQISLGQMKRVAIARTIRAGSKVLFLDEPLSGLDGDGGLIGTNIAFI